MSIERRENLEARDHAHLLQERFATGYLSRFQDLSQWVVWKVERKDEAAHKVPYNPRRLLYRASSKRPESWGTMQQALAAYSSGNFSGIGFMVTPPFVLIDLDHSFSRATQRISSSEATAIIKTLNSATEASPNTGIHIYLEGLLPGQNLHTPHIEIYTNWFTTITTDHIAGTPLDIQPRQTELSALYAQYAPRYSLDQNTSGKGEREASSNKLSCLPPEADSDPVLKRLLAGDTTAYNGDESRADFVLILKLLHWTGDDTALTRELFLASPLGKREKAQKKVGPTTYVDMTIRNAQKKRRNRPIDR
jgi:primase-polymerase (primpol)-like protein